MNEKIRLNNLEFAREKDAMNEVNRWIKVHPHYEFNTLEITSTGNENPEPGAGRKRTRRWYPRLPTPKGPPYCFLPISD